MARKRTSPAAVEPVIAKPAAVGKTESSALGIAGVVFTEAEREALRPPGKLWPSEWTEKHMVLPEGAPLGRYWRNEASPALAMLMDLAVEAWLRELTLQKAVQRGGSQIIRNILATMADQEPLPWLIVLTTEQTAKKDFRKKYLQMFRDCGPLKRLKTRRSADASSYGLRLSNGLEVDIGWAGSPATQATDPKACILNDEVDKWPVNNKEAPPLALSRRRTTKYAERSKVFNVSTPTIPDGPIHQAFLGSEIKVYFFVPCPHCGTHQRLTPDNLKWQKFHGEAAERAARIKAEQAAWFECSNPGCRGRIVESHKRQIVPRGYWATEDQGWKYFGRGREEGTLPPGDRVGAHLPSFDDYERKWHAIAAETVLAGSDAGALKDIVTQDHAEPFQQRLSAVAANDFAARCLPDAETGFVPAPARIVPPWASRLLLSIDTQGSYFWWVVRAYGYARRSQRIAHGVAESFEQLDAIEATPWRYAAGPDGRDLYPPLLAFRTGIDTGGTYDEAGKSSRTDQAYRWCLKRPLQRIPLKGSGKPIPRGVIWNEVEYTPPGGKADPYTVKLHLFDSETFAQRLTDALGEQVPTGETGDDGQMTTAPMWALNDQNDPEYNRHLSNVHVAVVKHMGHMQPRHVPKTPGARIDYHDVEKMLMAMSDGMSLCAGLDTPVQLAGRMATIDQPPGHVTHHGIRRPDGRGWFAKR